MKKIQENFIFIILSVFLLSACGGDDDSLGDGDADGDNDPLAVCLETCGELEDSLMSLYESGICGQDGSIYTNECQMECYGDEAALSMMYCRRPELSHSCKHYDTAIFQSDSCTLQLCEDVGDSDVGPTENSTLCEIPAPECFDDCEACSDDTSEWLCATDEALYCNACVMTCLEAEAADDGESCVEPVAQATACDDEGAIAGRDSGCNRCECKSGLWHCSDHACP